MTGAVVIRVATLADAALLARMGEETFRDTFAADNTPADMEAYVAAAFGEAQQAAELADPHTRVLIAEIGGEAVGYVRLITGPAPARVAAQRPMEISRFYARTTWIGRGVGAALMTRALHEAQANGCDAAWLGVWERNLRAIAFYERWGFRAVGEQVFVLGSDPQRDLVMVRGVS
jgi:ribosomal protein S18 acetylase RimI-like enzyme